MKRSNAKTIIRSNRERSGIRSDSELARVTGIGYRTLLRRMDDPGSMLLCELRVLAKKINLPDNELLELIKGQ
jgi:hypothetical protein